MTNTKRKVAVVLTGGGLLDGAGCDARPRDIGDGIQLLAEALFAAVVEGGR